MFMHLLTTCSGAFIPAKSEYTAVCYSHSHFVGMDRLMDGTHSDPLFHSTMSGDTKRSLNVCFYEKIRKLLCRCGINFMGNTLFFYYHEKLPIWCFSDTWIQLQSWAAKFYKAVNFNEIVIAFLVGKSFQVKLLLRKRICSLKRE